MLGCIGKKPRSLAQEGAEVAEVGISRVWMKIVLCALCALLFKQLVGSIPSLAIRL